MSNEEIKRIIARTYWVAFDNGRLVGKDCAPNFKQANRVIDAEVENIKALVRKEKRRTTKPDKAER